MLHVRASGQVVFCGLSQVYVMSSTASFNDVLFSRPPIGATVGVERLTHFHSQSLTSHHGDTYVQSEHSGLKK